MFIPISYLKWVYTTHITLLFVFHVPTQLYADVVLQANLSCDINHPVYKCI